MKLDKLTPIERRVLAESEETDDHTLQRLALDKNRYVQKAALENLERKSGLKELPDDWRQLSEEDRINRIHQGLADAETLQLLVYSGSQRIRKEIAYYDKTPDYLLVVLEKGEDRDVRQAVLDRDLPPHWRGLSNLKRIEKLSTEDARDISIEILDCLARSDRWTVRQAVALHEKTPSRILRLLAKDEDDDVRLAALDSRLPPEWRSLDTLERIERLSTSAVDEISLEILESLARSDEWGVRQAVALHEKTPNRILRLLGKDDDWDVRQAVVERSLPHEWRRLDEEERVHRLSTTTVESEVAEILSRSSHWRIRQSLARNPGVTEEILKRLSKDVDLDVREAALDGLNYRKLPEDWRDIGDKQRIQRLGRDQLVSSDVLETLAGSKNWHLRQAVARHDATPPSLIKQLSRDDVSEVRQAAILDRLLPLEWRYLNTEARLKRLPKEKLSPEILTAFARSDNWRLREAVANCLSTSEELLKELAKDSDSDVASAAKDAILIRRLPSEWVCLDANKRIERIRKGDVSGETLEILALSPSEEMRSVVASSLLTPIRSLRLLCEDEDGEVRQIAKQSVIRQSLPKDWIKLSETQLVERLQQEPVPQEILQALAMSDSVSTRDAVASNVCATIPILLSMKEDSSTSKRIQDLLRRTWAVPQQGASPYASNA